MSNYAKLYWLTRLDYLQGFFITIAVLMGIAVVIYSIIKGINNDWDDMPFNWRPIKIFVPIIAVLALIACFIPTRNEAILVIAGGRTMDFIQSDSSVNKLPGQTSAIISEFLDKQIKELKESK